MKTPKNKTVGFYGKKQEKKIREVNPKHIEEQQELFSKADQISPANKKIDKAEIIQLRDGSYLNIDDFVSNTYAEKSTHFYKNEFYYPIAELLGESRQIMDPFVKPIIVPKLKRALIYGRFPNAIQRRIYQRNKYISYYQRRYYNYQILTKKGDIELRQFICDFEEEMALVLNNGGNLKDFILSYSKKYKLPIQLELFF